MPASISSACCTKACAAPLRTAVQQAFSQHATVVQEDLGIEVEGQRQSLRLIAAPLSEAEGGKDLCVLGFVDVERVGCAGRADWRPRPKARASPR